MDPNETLKKIRAAIGSYRMAESIDDEETATFDMMEAFEDLDDWILKGGFLPDDLKHPLYIKYSRDVNRISLDNSYVL